MRVRVIREGEGEGQGEVEGEGEGEGEVEGEGEGEGGSWCTGYCFPATVTSVSAEDILLRD